MNLSSKARPMIDELKNGRWPSYIKEIEKSAADSSAKHSKQCTELLNLLEDSLKKNVRTGNTAVSSVLEVTAAVLSVVIPMIRLNILI